MREIIAFWLDRGVAGFRVDMAFSRVLPWQDESEPSYFDPEVAEADGVAALRRLLGLWESRLAEAGSRRLCRRIRRPTVRPLRHRPASPARCSAPSVT
ncbi:MAG: hypothetical protein QM619_02560 [Micropruina sp.]|uniref:hypothetical protein n=1 Tax=Micropruina sp. TaxID=2737536 RepID=UPI0039E5382F